MTEQQPAPKQCRDCRFYSKADCINEESKGHNEIGDVTWKSAREMREPFFPSDGPGRCGRDAKLFEPRPPRTVAQVVANIFIVIVCAGFLIAMLSLKFVGH